MIIIMIIIIIIITNITILCFFTPSFCVLRQFSFLIFYFTCPKSTIPSKELIVGSGTGKLGQVKLMFSAV